MKPNLVFLSLATFLLCSCHSYYKSTSMTKQDVPEVGNKLDSLKASGRYLILRNGMAGAYHIAHVEMSADKKTATVLLDEVPADHKHHLAGSGTNWQYRELSSLQRGVLEEVHVYAPYDAAAKTGRYPLALDKVEKVEVLQYDSKRTFRSHVLGAVGYTFAGFGLLVIGLALFWHPHF